MYGNEESMEHPKSIYIGRPSKWGNPYKIGEDGSREEVIEKYRQYITKGKGKHLLKDLHELKGKYLRCWCYPLPCHGDILVELIEKWGVNK